jgi:hypothetical protein
MTAKIRSTAHADKIDAAGVGLSALCVAHCLLLPVAAAAPLGLPAAGEMVGLEHDGAHLVFFFLALPLAAAGFIWGGRIAKAGWRTFAAGALGLALMAAGFAHIIEFPGSETSLTLIGVALLAGAHLANWRARQRTGHAHEKECEVCSD